jgi:single-strand DNA-binding protein
MDGLNQVTLIGSVGKDAETKFIGEGSQKATFSLATNRTYKKNGEKVTETEWHNVEVWAETAKFAGQYVKKGQLALILGRIKYEKWDDKEGNKHQKTVIIADRIQLLPKGTPTGSDETKGETAAAAAQTEEYAAASQASSAQFVNSADDDLPF